MPLLEFYQLAQASFSSNYLYLIILFLFIFFLVNDAISFLHIHWTSEKGHINHGINVP